MWLYHFQDISNHIQFFINIKLLTLTPPLCWFIVTLLVLGTSFFTHRHQGCVSCIALSPQSIYIQMWMSSLKRLMWLMFSFISLHLIIIFWIFWICMFMFFVSSCLLLLQFCYSCTIFVFNLFLQAFFTTMTILEFILTTILKFPQLR